MNEKSKTIVSNDQKQERENKTVINPVETEVMEAKENVEKEEIKKDEEAKTIEQSKPTGFDRINQALLMMTKVEVKPFYNTDYSKKYAQLQRMCQCQPYIKIHTAKDSNGKSLFWVAIGKSERIKFPLKANTESFLSLLNYIQNGTLDSEVDFSNSDLDGLDEDWEILYLKKLCQSDCDLKTYFGNKDNVYITHPAKFGELTFNLKEEGNVKFIIAEILSK